MKAVITAVGKAHRHLLLQTMTDAHGHPVSILRMQLHELRQAGVERIGIVVNPGDESLLEGAAGEWMDRIESLPQSGPSGYANAILTAEPFAAGGPFLLSVADHLFVSDDPEQNCFKQVIDQAEQLNASVSAVQATAESHIHRFGTLGGERVEGRDDLIRVAAILEKPTPTQAEQQLIVSGLRAGTYLSFFGLHVLEPSIFGHLRHCVAEAEDPTKVTLTDALNASIAEQDHYAFEVNGRRFDLEAPFGLLHGQVAVALKSPNREQILSDLLQLVAER